MTKIQVLPVLSLLALGLASTSPLLAAERLKAGEWEFTTTVQGQAPRTFKKCMTSLDASSVNGDEKTGRAAAEKSAGKHCALKEYKIVGDTVTYALACDSSAITSTATYHGDSFEGTMTAKREGKESTTRVKGRLIGACP
jgi:rare lipoprotein A (peptidoglycan hydrolase)